METAARRLFRLVEPIHLVTYFADEPTSALMALGYRNYWDGYFAGRAAPLGRVPAEVVHAVFYNFADGEVSRHIPRVWETATPEAALAARERGSVAALRRILDDLADAPSLARAAELGTREAIGAPTEGRVLYAALSSLPIPEDPVARLGTRPPCSASTAETVTSPRTLVTEGIGGTEAMAALRGHPSGEVRQSPPPPCSAAGRRCREDARPRPHRSLRLA